MSGRSRGRARIRVEGQQPPSPGVPKPTPTPEPPAPVVPEVGRGRGLTTTPTTPKPKEEATNISSEESPPQQPSPPSGSEPGTAQPTAILGRAALRGAPHQVGISVRTELLPPLERLQLQDSGDVKPPEPRREVRVDSVLYTKPANCVSKEGQSGQKIRMLTNYFRVVEKPDWVLYQYHVDYAPVIDSKGLRIGLLKNHDSLFPTNKAFDGSTLYSLDKLHDELTEVASTRQSDGQIIQIKIKRVGEIVPQSPQFIHLFNLVFRKCLKLYGMQEIDRSYYDMRNRIPVPEYNLDFINGLSTSIDNYDSGLLLCAELTHKLLHKSTIHDEMKKIHGNSRSYEDFKERCMGQLIGRIVMTQYNNKTYKIDDIDWDSNPDCSFNTRKGDVTFMQYYETQYGIKIKDNKQPLLVSLPSGKDKRRAEQIGQEAKPALLVPELCIVTGVDDQMRMDFKFKKAIERYSKVGPEDRCSRIRNFVSTFRQQEKVYEKLQEWAMDFNNEPASLDGRVLALETLMFGSNRVLQLKEKADWGFDMKNMQMLSAVNLNNWIIVYPSSKRHAASMFAQTYSEVIRSMGIQARQPREVQVTQDSPEQLVNSLKQNIDGNTQMVVVVVTSKRKDRYDAVKRICCLEKPVPSQVCTSMIIEDDKKRRSVLTKIAIQMNCKLGGEVWRTNIPLKNVMICGIDTYHDSAKKHGSVCAFIATCNATHTKYFSRATLQETHQELSSNLSITVKSACEHYKRVNGFFPEKLIIYRDGVSDGQLSLVKEHEIPQIEKAFAMIDSNYKPLMAVIIVKKRGNARFFAMPNPNSRQLINPPCGSVIDTVITRPEWFDFYLISQHSTQGTTNPTHYNVIHSTIDLKAEHYQKLSYKLTHMYYNWPGTIRVPSTCQYAHKLAFLVGQSLHKEHHSSLCDKLFFL